MNTPLHRTLRRAPLLGPIALALSAGALASQVVTFSSSAPAEAAEANQAKVQVVKAQEAKAQEAKAQRVKGVMTLRRAGAPGGEVIELLDVGDELKGLGYAEGGAGLSVITDLASGQETGFLGVSLGGKHDGDGALVDGTLPGSAAEKAGFKSGDVIVSINGDDVDDTAELIKVLRGTSPGDKVTVRYLRDGKKRKAKFKLGSRDALQAATEGGDVPGASTDEPNIARRVKVRRRRAGRLEAHLTVCSRLSLGPARSPVQKSRGDRDRIRGTGGPGGRYRDRG